MDAVDKIGAFMNGMSFEEIEALEKRQKKFKKKEFGSSVLEGLK